MSCQLSLTSAFSTLPAARRTQPRRHRLQQVGQVSRVRCAPVAPSSPKTDVTFCDAASEEEDDAYEYADEDEETVEYEEDVLARARAATRK